jgi:hypothetical protein
LVCLSNLQRLFADAEPATLHRIAEALLERIEVFSPNEAWPYPSAEAEARGWAAAMSGEFRVEVREIGRGERICAVMSDAATTVRFVRRSDGLGDARTA